MFNTGLPAWGVMWGLAGSIYLLCKWVTWHAADVRGVPWWKHAAYLGAWPGMDAAAFLTQRSAARPAAREWTFASLTFAAGGALVGVAVSLVSVEPPYVIGWIGMLGIVLSLHFGLFRLLSCVWRRIGIDARPLMDRPLAATSVGEFWSRRWNTAFRDLTHRLLFRPLTPWLGPRGAIAGGFLFSGLVHDLVISLPARGGYGGPTLFFALQALATIAERSSFGRRIGLGGAVTGRVFTFTVVAMPLYLLLHPPFVERVVAPFIAALGA
jgi:alginate O-acetyltransferase complex protein AlgI